MSDKTIYNILLDGSPVDRVMGWDTAVRRASACVGHFGESACVADGNGEVLWRWDESWGEPFTAVQNPVAVPDNEVTSFNPAHTFDLTMLFLAVSLTVNVALFWVLYFLIF